MTEETKKLVMEGLWILYNDSCQILKRDGEEWPELRDMQKDRIERILIAVREVNTL